jgi:hypothetical protein
LVVGLHEAETTVVPLPPAHVVRATWVPRSVTDWPDPPSSADGWQPLTTNVRTDARWCAWRTGASFVHAAADACSADATNGMSIRAHPATEIAMRR